MALPPERPLTDPLLEPDAGPLDHVGAPIRAPIGNSARTLLLLGLVGLLGVAIWWFQRPSDLSDELGGHSWAVIEVDGEAPANEVGQLPTYVLFGAGGLRSGSPCGTARGDWSFDTASQRLTIDWSATDDAGCESATVIESGKVSIDGAAMTLEGDDHTIRSLAFDSLPVVEAEDLAGRWSSGGSMVEFGQRGLLLVDECSGNWMATGEGITPRFDDDVECQLDPVWTGDDVLIPALFEESLYLRPEDGSLAPLYRLDPAPERIAPVLEGS
ncbi:MAG: hypothetical protein QNJ12_04185 [Ilumatobacter sp.]|uniref:hypothetical protein n=1 Tax=Ilumatobacter sp. TaxID=1967498 RepID=UPI002630F63B|nr:hypothetical protein [Ilumatobacter sp.]MDJ0767963.1 hypothetical protein [Ilumatobacter sp.]